jgi:hypothetical protein
MAAPAETPTRVLHRAALEAQGMAYPDPVLP